MTVLISIDPERISERIFGGPHFRAFEPLGGWKMRCLKTGKVWDERKVSVAWSESRNCPAEDAA